MTAENGHPGHPGHPGPPGPPHPDEVKRTNPDRLVFPEDGITKGAIVDYYTAVAPRMLPHLAGRPLSLERYRKDIHAGGFYQQGRSDHFPDYVDRIDVTRADGSAGHHTGVANPAALAYLANQGVLTFHGWSATRPQLEHPDRLVIDLDPDTEDFAPVRKAALTVKAILEEDFGYTRTLPLLTGSRGLHVIVPLPDRDATWDELWARAKEIGAALVKTAPQELTRARFKSQRKNRLYVDMIRARRGQTAIVPWTVRARPGAPVAAPVTWDELRDDDSLHARSYTVRTVLEQRPEDPWLLSAPG